MSDYDALFQLRIEHEFFTGCTSLPFYGEWLPGSQQAATSIGLLTKPQADGVQVLADRTHPALQAVEHVTLRWWFGSREPNFFQLHRHQCDRRQRTAGTEDAVLLLHAERRRTRRGASGSE
ncbi:hypothetical protein [Dickeya oryzae]